MEKTNAFALKEMLNGMIYPKLKLICNKSDPFLIAKKIISEAWFRIFSEYLNYLIVEIMKWLYFIIKRFHLIGLLTYPLSLLSSKSSVLVNLCQ